jgi:Baculovirus F protein
MGTALTKVGIWTIIYNFDMVELSKEIITLKRLKTELEELCDNIPTNDSLNIQCRRIREILKDDFEEIMSKEDYLENKIGKEREKRSINFLGKFEKWMKGTLDYEDGLYYDRQLEILKGNEENIKHNADKQITIIKSIFEATNKSFYEAENTLKELRLQKSGNTAAMQIINLLLLKEKISRKQKLLEDVAITPDALTIKEVIRPKTLLKQLKAINEIKGNTTKFAFPIHEEYIAQFYKMAEIKIEKHDSNALIILEIPLVDSEEKIIYRVSPIPQKRHNKIVIPNNQHSFLAIGKRHYSSYSAEEIDKCFKKNATYICPEKLAKLIEPETTCEIQKFSHRLDGDKCTWTEIDFKEELFIKLLEKNDWMYVVRNTTPIQIKCSNNTDLGFLNASGIIKIDDLCDASTNKTRLKTKGQKGQTRLKVEMFKLNMTYDNILPEKIKIRTNEIDIQEHERLRLIQHEISTIPKITLNDIEEHPKNDLADEILNKGSEIWGNIRDKIKNLVSETRYIYLSIVTCIIISIIFITIRFINNIKQLCKHKEKKGNQRTKLDTKDIIHMTEIICPTNEAQIEVNTEISGKENKSKENDIYESIYEIPLPEWEKQIQDRSDFHNSLVNK